MKMTLDDWATAHGLGTIGISKQRNISFSLLEKALRDIGIQLTEIQCSTTDTLPETEIRGYIINDPMFGMSFTAPKIMGRPQPKKVIFSGPATTILWKDGTKTTVKCQGDDVFNHETGIALCYLKKMLGNKGNYNNIFREAMKVTDIREKAEELSPTEGGLSLYEAALKKFNKKWNEAMESLTKEEK